MTMTTDPHPRVPTRLVDVVLADEPGPDDVLVALLGSADSDGAVGPGVAMVGIDDAAREALGASGRAGSLVRTPGGARLLGIGAGTSGDWRSAGGHLARGFRGSTGHNSGTAQPGPSTAAVALPTDLDSDALGAFVVGVVVGSHGYRVSADAAPDGLRTVRLLVGPDADRAVLRGVVERAVELARATGLARDLATTPSDVKSPDWLASTAARIAGEVPGLDVTVRDEHWLAEHGFGGVLAVGGGSARPPRLVELSWAPAEVRTDEHLVLVGKGITFDTGGISIKPADGMHLMRTDMSGGAAVIAALVAIARLRLPIRVSGLVPCAENHVSGSAYRPGDVVTHVGGTTTEITNTDAEGRIVLADALAYAVAEYQPTTIVDVATLTGAMKVALGTRTAGYFASRDDLASRVAAAGDDVGEAWWRMPLSDEHADAVRSELADVRQAPPGPGAITAALFLREFTDGLPWAHLDIAGPARADTAYAEVNPGGTGFAARTLVALASHATR